MEIPSDLIVIQINVVHSIRYQLNILKWDTDVKYVL